MQLTFVGVPEAVCRITWVPVDDPEVYLGSIDNEQPDHLSNTFNTHMFAFYVEGFYNETRNGGTGAGFVGAVTANIKLGNHHIKLTNCCEQL